MACDLSMGRKSPCQKGVGGIKAFYLMNYIPNLPSRLVFDGTSVKITGFPTDVTPVNLYKYELRDNGQSLEETNEVSGENGTSFVTQTLTASLKKHTSDFETEANFIQRGNPQIIVEDYNRNFFLLGQENGCDVQINKVTGAAMGDLSGYNITATAKEQNLSAHVDPEIIGDGTETDIVEGSEI